MRRAAKTKPATAFDTVTNGCYSGYSSGEIDPFGQAAKGDKMAKATRYWVVERDAEGNSVDDYMSYSSLTAANREARRLRLNPMQADTATVEVGRVVNFEAADEFTQVICTVAVAKAGA